MSTIAEGLTILEFDVSPDSAVANEKINAALAENGIEQSVNIPDGWMNIFWIVLNQPPEKNLYFSLRHAASKDAFKASFALSPKQISTLTDNTAGGYVLWAGQHASTNPNPPQRMSSAFANHFIQAVISENSYNAGSTAQVVAEKVITVSSVEGNTATGVTYPSPPYSRKMYVRSGESIVLADYLKPTNNNAALVFSKYELGSGVTYGTFDATTGRYTAPTSEDEGDTVKLNAVFVENTNKKQINITETENGNVATTPSEQASPGENVAITITPNNGYIVDDVKVTYGEDTPVESLSGSGNNWSFVMPDGDVTISVTFTRFFSVTVNVEGAGGTATASPDKDVKEGDTVTLNIVPSEGYKLDLDSVTAKYGEGLKLELKGEGNTLTFTMPAGNVTITVAFMELDMYNVNIQPMEHGSITANPKSAYEGQTVTLSIKPDKGYALKSFYIYISETRNAEYKSDGVTQITFKMPASNVTVHATFEEATYKTVVGAAVIKDSPGNNPNKYKGKHYDDSNTENPDNPIVGEYSVGEPTYDEDGVAHYVLTATDLRLFAAQTESSWFSDTDSLSNTYGYYVGLTLEPCDGGSQTYDNTQYSAAVANSKDEIRSDTLRASWTNSHNPVKIYFKLDPDKPKQEFWFLIGWAQSGDLDLSDNFETICVTVDTNFKPITHTYEVPDNTFGGFSGTEKTTESRGVINSNNFNDGYKEILTPAELGWIIPTSWTWHWEIDGDKSKQVTSNNFNSDLSAVLNDGFGHYYDHTFKLVIDDTAPKTVTVTQSDGGNITLSPSKADNKYNSGETVAVKVTPNNGYDISSLTVGGEDVSSLLENGEYSFVVTSDVTVTAAFIQSDSEVSSIKVDGKTAFHTGEKEWSITLPYGFAFPDVTTGSGITFDTNSSTTVTLKSPATGDDREKTYTFVINGEEYTVKVTIAEPPKVDLTVSVDNGGKPNETKKIPEGETVDIELESGFGYALPDTITVSVSGVILSPSKYSYTADEYKSTGRLTIPGAEINGNVEVKVQTVYGSVHVAVRSNSEDIFIVGYDDVKKESTQTNNPVYDMHLPRTGDSVDAIQDTNIAAAAVMVPSDSQTSSGGGNDGSQSGNPYQWVIPKWLTFDGWYVNQDKNGNQVESKGDYIKLTRTNGDGSYPYQPQSKNHNPIIEARWIEQDTYTLTVTLMPGADDVRYGGSADDHPDLWNQPVTAENAMKVTAKAAITDELKLYIPKTYYERDNYHFGRWIDEHGNPIEMGTDGAITVSYDGENKVTVR